jgi:hypothetical protein
MPSMLNTAAVEESTYIITISCKNAAGSGVTPNSCKWRLLDEDGNTVNNRTLTTVPVALSTAMNIILSSHDLALPDPTKPRRKVLIVAKYNETGGTSKPLNDEVTFNIIGLQGVT